MFVAWNWITITDLQLSLETLFTLFEWKWKVSIQTQRESFSFFLFILFCFVLCHSKVQFFTLLNLASWSSTTNHSRTDTMATSALKFKVLKLQPLQFLTILLNVFHMFCFVFFFCHYACGRAAKSEDAAVNIPAPVSGRRFRSDCNRGCCRAGIFHACVAVLLEGKS